MESSHYFFSSVPKFGLICGAKSRKNTLSMLLHSLERILNFFFLTLEFKHYASDIDS